MRKILLIILMFFTLPKAEAQDLGVVTSSSPVSGCVLSATEVVEVFVFNFGPDVSTSFDVSYSIDGGPPISETVNLGTFLSSSSYTHTFSIPADLSIPGSYNLCYYTTVAGETNNLNDTVCVVVVNDALTISGTTEFDDTVCTGINNGTINLTGSLGDVLEWQNSGNSGASWVDNFSNTTTVETYSNLTTETWYRAVVKNGLCPSDTSTIVKISLDQPSIGGVLSGPDTVCVGVNSGSITLSGEFGLISGWEYSENSGVSWLPIINTSNSEPFNNITLSRDYRALVINETCPVAYSDTFHVEVVPGATGGNLSAPVNTVCMGQNTTTISLSGYSGTIDHWETSVNGGGSWDTLANQSDFYQEIDLSIEIWYRVIVSACIWDTSSIFILGVDQLSIAGTLSGDSAVCPDVNAGAVSLTGPLGSVTDWIYSEDGGVTWGSLMNQNLVYNYSNLQSETMYISLVQNGVCPVDSSNSVLVTLFAINSGVGLDTIINFGDVANLYAFGGGTYSWSPSTDLDDSFSGTPIASPSETTTYVVEITDTNSCLFVDSVEVALISEGFEISNLITANNDGFNDYWIIRGLESYSNVSVQIINKKGVEVYSSDNYLNDWDGSFQGNYLPTGTYYYIVEHPEISVVTGHLNILSND